MPCVRANSSTRSVPSTSELNVPNGRSPLDIEGMLRGRMDNKRKQAIRRIESNDVPAEQLDGGMSGEMRRLVSENAPGGESAQLP